MTDTKKLRPRVRDAILQSLAAGVVPRIGQQHIQVGRVHEVRALLKDIDRIADGGSTMRFIIGEYGSGKTFFLHLIRSIALERKLVTAHADLNPDRRIHATGGQAQGLYQELMRNLSTRSKPDGNALASVVERFVTTAMQEAQSRKIEPESVIRSKLDVLTGLVGGYDFSEVVASYWRAHDTGDDALKANAVRWLRAEFTTKTAARKALGVRTIIEDSNTYDMLKLFARFVELSGFGGLLICLDELVNLYKLGSGRARRTNYEQILRILNDSLQGGATPIGFLMGGTPEFLLDTRKGLYSYEALQTRLTENSFARAGGLVDFSGPVLRLANLAPEDLFVLLQKVRDIHAAGQAKPPHVPNEALAAFMQHCSQRVGDAYFKTPRNTIVAFVHLLSTLEQNPTSTWEALLNRVSIQSEHNPELAPLEDTSGDDDDDELADFKL